jgi:glycerophosphoryl diester phosphodiesterase
MAPAIYAWRVPVVTSHPIRRASRIVALIVVASCADAQVSPPLNCPASTFRNTPPLVIAHAGGEGLGPANTIVAMRRSLDAGVAWAGDPIEEIARIPSLDEILKTFPDTLISLEIKQVTPSMSDALCTDLRDADALGRVYVSSNTDEALYAARDACPGMLITTTYADLEVRRAAAEAGEPWCAIAPIGQPPYRDDRFDERSVADAHAHGQAIFTWTVDDPDALLQLAEAGVDGVYTRRPDMARTVFDEYARSTGR